MDRRIQWQVDDAKSLMDTLINMIEELEGICTKYEKEIDELKDQISDNETDMRTLRNTIEELEKNQKSE